MDDNLKTRILQVTQGSQLGAILACAMEVELPGPRFTSKAICTSDGYLQANFVDSEGVTRHNAFIGSYGELEQNICRLNAHLGLDEAQRLEMHGLVSDWIAIDYR